MNIHDIKIEDLKNSDDKYYLYCWWSGLCIEQEICKVLEINNNRIYFYNDYTEERQDVCIKDCRLEDNIYIDEMIQH